MRGKKWMEIEKVKWRGPEKGRKDVISHREGRERQTDRWTDGWNRERTGRGGGGVSHRGRELYCLCACWKLWSLSSCCCFWTWLSTVTEWRPLGASVPLLTCNRQLHKSGYTQLRPGDIETSRSKTVNIPSEKRENAHKHTHTQSHT